VTEQHALWDGVRRLPYFFAFGEPSEDKPRTILCPQCALEHVERDPNRVHAYYHVSRSIMCARCGIVIGPINKEEQVSYDNLT